MMSLEKSLIGFAWILLSQTYLWTRKSTSNFGSHPDPDSESESGQDSRWWRSALSKCLWVITAFKVIQGHRGRCQSKARMRHPISD